jgi:hypothetical protein
MKSNTRTALQEKYDGKLENIFEITTGLLDFKRHQLRIETLVQLLIDDAIDEGDSDEAGEYALAAVRLIHTYGLNVLPF